MGMRVPLTMPDGAGQVVETKTLIEHPLTINILVSTTLPTIPNLAAFHHSYPSTIPVPPIPYVANLTPIYSLIPK
jgi:hypothetical protein